MDLRPGVLGVFGVLFRTWLVLGGICGGPGAGAGTGGYLGGPVPGWVPGSLGGSTYRLVRTKGNMKYTCSKRASGTKGEYYDIMQRSLAR